MMHKCLIIDDEKPARELVKNYVEMLPGFEVVGLLENAVDGKEFLENNKVDLLFVDIQMPQLSGLELANSLEEKPQIIFTTAFREFAVEGFELEALDYLVKPISRDRFMKAIDKYLHYETLVDTVETGSFPASQAYIFLKVGKEQRKILLNDILYIEGLKDYLKVFTKTEILVVRERLGYMELKLPGENFARIHKSFIVALNKIEGFTTSIVKIGNQELPIGRSYKKDFEQVMAELQL
ncbi:LytTR family DNA-binding domain-containing protein [Jiulongibacter sediminis]|jgi:DNA-binding LytR/AlgR family response regulator|uniref:LytR/AlgR family response regulator transcription factor n=1 Tax=Jiulongibacter sediminis TaxID=1605367 RepID=UPI0026EFD9AB|nr:LytTR family DNA-binding domain-containing protein [Jiulongibacter sediminis]